DRTHEFGHHEQVLHLERCSSRRHPASPARILHRRPCQLCLLPMPHCPSRPQGRIYPFSPVSVRVRTLQYSPQNQRPRS
ncbi:hypothetical protein PMAYCL1PPCAC_32434, partial [Pristionchus mayeri]